MTFDTMPDDLWGGDFSPQAKQTSCAYAMQFKSWTDELCATTAEAASATSAVIVYRAYVQLLTRYFDWRAAVPKAHRNRIGEVGHTCIFHVFAEAYQQLRAIELSLAPPLLLLPAPPPAPTQPVFKLSGIPLGEIDEEEGT